MVAGTTPKDEFCGINEKVESRDKCHHRCTVTSSNCLFHCNLSLRRHSGFSGFHLPQSRVLCFLPSNSLDWLQPTAALSKNKWMDNLGKGNAVNSHLRKALTMQNFCMNEK